MPTSLYQATVPQFVQVLTALAGLVDKARAHCADKALPDESLTELRLAPDMWPFAKQVMAACQHSAGAVTGAQSGETGPDLTPPPLSLDALASAVAAAIASLQAIAPEQIDGIASDEMAFVFGERRMLFSAEDYLLSFAQPNFYFHAAMAWVWKSASATLWALPG